MRKFIIIIVSLILFGFTASALAEEERKTTENPSLTDEDKEIVEILEMMEMMEILKEMELMKDYHLFAEEGTDEKEN
ncbi:MAG: hypothetical protein HF978_03630 [Desulfobacteraceae bacterium]|nr:hypothetical protein [Desulfobacteraceae bacterium]MBC2754617.1 hypothetical protein [Desulfobacteraceae bacterium]